ncbi:MAG: hypothetical protein RIC52_04330 [Amphiplicatus sp.]
MADLGAIVIDKRFCGPAGSANGGYASGALAAFIDGPAEVTLKAPPPLGARLAVERRGDGVVALSGETLVAEARPAGVAADLPPIPDAKAIDAARAEFHANPQSRIFPNCFVCGPRRDDGLRIFAGAASTGVNADYWTPADDLAGPDGLIAPEFVWAALDCPSAFALRRTEGLCLLGRYAVDIARRPKPGERLTVIAWKERSDGRKHFASSALVDENGEAAAIANALWIDVADPVFLERLKQENA